MKEQRVGEGLKKFQVANTQKSNNLQNTIQKQIPNKTQNTKSTLNKKSQIFYLELDINQTEKRFKQYAKDYNKELQNTQFLKEQYQIHQEFKVPVQESIKSLSIKASHVYTVLAMAKAYYRFLKNLEKSKTRIETEFTMNGQALASMTNMSARSSRRHVNKLLATGFLEEKTFKGRKASYTLKINPEFIVARPHKKLSEMLINQHKEKYPGIPINPITFKQYMSIRPSFKDYPSGLLRSICPSLVILQDTLNNNILSKGIVDNCLHTKSQMPQKLIVINNELNDSSSVGNPDNKKQEQTIVRPHLNPSQAYQQKVQRENQSPIPPALYSVIFDYTELAWNFAHSLLYQNRQFEQEQVQIAKQFIAGYFQMYVKYNNPKTMSKCYDDFILTIQIIDEYAKRKVEWQLARPEFMFKPSFNGGFYKAYEKWLPKHKARQQKNKDWNTNKILVGKLYRYYSADPTSQRYNLCIERLDKLKNKKFLDTFNSCVLDKNKYNKEFINQNLKN